MNKYQMAEMIYSRYGKDIGFLANVIITHHDNQSRKIKGLLNLLAASHRVRLGQFSIDRLYVDDIEASWIVLEEWARRKQ